MFRHDCFLEMVHRTGSSRAHFQAHNEKPAQEPSGGDTQVRAIFHLVDLAIGVKAIVTKTPCSVTIDFLKWFTEREARGRTFKCTTKNRSGVTVTRNCYYNAVLIS